MAKKPDVAEKKVDRAFTVAEYMERALMLTDKSQMEIAAECGFANPNILTMIKNNKTKVPLGKVDLLARALDIDGRYLLRLCMMEYMPDTWTAIFNILGLDAMKAVVSDSELVVLETIRGVADNWMPNMEDDYSRNALETVLRELHSRDTEKNRRDLEAFYAKPRNARRAA